MSHCTWQLSIMCVIEFIEWIREKVEYLEKYKVNEQLRPFINKTCISSITNKNLSKYVLLLLLFLIRIQQSLFNSVHFSCQKYQIAHNCVELRAFFSLIVNGFYVSQHSNCYVRVRVVRFTKRPLSQSDLHFFETQEYVQFLKQTNIIYVIMN